MRTWFRRQTEYLYLFQHVAKCAGTSINHAILDQGAPSIFIKEKRATKAEVRAEVEAALAARPGLEQSLEVIHGHRVFYGLHEYSRRTPRYFTFLRDPVPRCISAFNYFARNAFDPNTKLHERDRARMIRDGELIPFREWLAELYDDNQMTRFLAAAMEGEAAPPYVGGPVTDDHLRAAKEFLQHCFFIGFTEQSERDVPAIFELLRLTPPRERANVSPGFFGVDQDSSVVGPILERNAYDVELYQYARALRERADASAAGVTRAGAAR